MDRVEDKPRIDLTSLFTRAFDTAVLSGFVPQRETETELDRQRD